jgi:pentatricopeptide repeat protein
MSGYSQIGEDETVIDLCNRMMSESIEPNAVTFNVILNACSHQGLLEKGQMYFRMMSRTYGIIPSLEHHTCIVDLLSRAGRFHEAVEVIQKMPTSDYLPVWASLLGSCQKWGNFELGKVAFEHAIQLDEGNATTYIYMSNLCLMKL